MTRKKEIVHAIHEPLSRVHRSGPRESITYSTGMRTACGRRTSLAGGPGGLTFVDVRDHQHRVTCASCLSVVRGKRPEQWAQLGYHYSEETVGV